MLRAGAYGEHKGGDPDADEDVVAENSAEDVSLAVNLSRVQLVEQRHRHERSEHHRVVHVRFRQRLVVVCIVNVEQQLPYRK